MASSDSPSGSKAAASYSTDPALYIYTSLTAGSSHIVTATSRLETILRANRVPFKAIDIATDEKARMLWGRRAGKDEGGRMRKLPGLVQMGLVLGDLVEIEDWNEYGELKQHVTIYHDEFTQPPIGQASPQPPIQKKPTPAPTPTAAPAAPPAPPLPTAEDKPQTTVDQAKAVASAAVETVSKVTLPIRSIAEEAAAKAKQVHLQSLRDKVYGKGGSKDAKPSEEPEKKEEEKEADKSVPPAASDEAAAVTAADLGKPESHVSTTSVPSTIVSVESTAAGLQSPTTGAWKGVAGGEDNPLQTLQSPTSATWKPSDVDAPITTFSGALVESASAEEIECVEKEETILEEPEKEEEAEEEDEEAAEKSEKAEKAEKA